MKTMLLLISAYFTLTITDLVIMDMLITNKFWCHFIRKAGAHSTNSALPTCFLLHPLLLIYVFNLLRFKWQSRFEIASFLR